MEKWRKGPPISLLHAPIRVIGILLFSGAFFFFTSGPLSAATVGGDNFDIVVADELRHDWDAMMRENQTDHRIQAAHVKAVGASDNDLTNLLFYDDQEIRWGAMTALAERDPKRRHQILSYVRSSPGRERFLKDYLQAMSKFNRWHWHNVNPDTEKFGWHKRAVLLSSLLPEMVDDAGIFPAIFKAAYQRGDPEIQAKVIESMGKHRRFLEGKDVFWVLTEASKSEDAGLRLAAVMAIEGVESKESLEILKSRLKKEKNDDIEQMVRLVLSKRRDEESAKLRQKYPLKAVTVETYRGEVVLVGPSADCAKNQGLIAKSWGQLMELFKQ